MNIVSIDFSILYPGACICKNFKEFKWIALANTDVRKKDSDNFDYINLNYPSIKILRTTTRRKKELEYHLTERTKLINYLEAIDLFVSQIEKELNGEAAIVCLEGISFGSSGNSLVDISQATGILKHQLTTRIIKNQHDKMFIFSPSELKNAIGCKGNANKKDILAKFKSDPILESVKSSDLFKLVNQESWVVDGEKVLSPITDMVDSYLGVVKVHALVK